MKDAPTITEDTRFNLKFNNLYAIAVMLIIFTFWATVTYIQLQTVIINQKELTMEFKTWRIQAEDRLGKTQSRQSQVVGFLRNEFGFEILN